MINCQVNYEFGKPQNSIKFLLANNELLGKLAEKCLRGNI